MKPQLWGRGDRKRSSGVAHNASAATHNESSEPQRPRPLNYALGNLFSTTFESFIPLPDQWLRLDCSRQAIFYVKSGRLGR
jgi:hypothetical protein